MGKALTEPLFLGLVALLLLQAWSWGRTRRMAQILGSEVAPGPGPRAVALGVTLVVWVASTGLGARLALHPLEAPFTEFGGADPETQHVVVLTGGLWPGPHPGLDLPNGWSSVRLDRGVEAFQESDASHLVITGGVPRPDGERGDLARLLAERAERMGVPPERIVLETRSHNTRAHPVEVEALDEVAVDEPLAVVTSAWHLPRALAEFRRRFHRVEGVPAEFAAPRGAPFVEWVLPTSRHLGNTTRAFHEHAGRAWYAVRALLEG